jgi:hypothetical protein
LLVRRGNAGPSSRPRMPFRARWTGSGRRCSR